LLGKILNVFRVVELRKKIVYTLFIIALYRLGTYIVLPYVNYDQVKTLTAQAEENGILGFLNLFSGGGLTNLSLFALGIMPYITASIIIQLLGAVIPKLAQWQEEGQIGQKKITQTTRYITIVLAFMQASVLVFQLNSTSSVFYQNLPNGALQDGKYLLRFNIGVAILMIITLVAATTLLMWLGETITQRGIGNGISMIIFASVVASFPAQGGILWSQSKFIFFIMLALFVFMIFAIVYVESGQRRVPVQFAKRQVGRKLYGGQNTYIPLKLNQSGIIPAIFAGAFLYFPIVVSGFIPSEGYRQWVQDNLANSTSWYYVIAYASLIVMFAYVYTAVQFNPAKQAENIRKQGGSIPGVRPGPDMEKYLTKVVNRITLPGASFLAAVAVLPFVAIIFGNITNVSFIGTSLFLAVGVALETMKQINGQMTVRNYEGFLS
jgi:preprotein translocase subunit SecY